MKRILFVDDEPRVLEGIRRMLWTQRSEWEMHFAPGGEAALDAVEKQEFDVVVADMRMPGVNGVELLHEIQKRHPKTVRMVLSGQSEEECTLSSVSVAHRFLSKPCEAQALKEAIDRTYELQNLLGDEALKETVAGLGSLPSAPAVYKELTRALADPDTPLAELAGIVERDSAISAKVLQVVNSGFFGLARPMTSIRGAISYLGASAIRSLVLGASVFGSPEGQALSWFPIDSEQRHGILTARISSSLFDEEAKRDTAFAAGMLHDIGALVLATRLGQPYRTILEEAVSVGRPLHEMEREAVGVSHAEVGAYLLGLWGLPHDIVEAVAFHHAPGAPAHAAFDTSAAVHVADCLAHEALPGARPDGSALDSDYCERLGLTERLDGLRVEAARLATAEI